jgi:deazaflavin-dependent oxidoreductase (nitroreductase family)
MGERLLLLTHTGRKSSLPRYAVLEVARHDASTGTFLVPAAYGRKADWYLNLQETPEVVVNHRGKRQDVVAETLPVDAAAAEFAVYAAAHPTAAKSLGKLMGVRFDDLEALAKKVPLVALRPR